MLASFLLPIVVCGLGAEPLPTFEVKADNTVITKSCRLVIAPGAVIADTDKNGVIQINAGDAAGERIVVEFAPGSVLRGAGAEVSDDELEGVGIRIVGRAGVTIRGAVIEGFRAGVHATKADGLVIENAKVLRNRRQHLRSTPQAEDGADWLWPHKNDGKEWLANYGAAVYVEQSSGVTLRGITVRNSQNGVVIDRLVDSKIYDNDCSFLSGWGLAMWRSGHNVISRNAIDFCVRGYSHGVYNRGQDSAGILCFEQCSDNVFIENSVTHGGDGFFGFAGREALGEGDAAPAGFSHTDAGVNRNMFVRNDLSYAPAHGLELTFSFDDWVIDNRFVGNNICGIWGGYSQRMHISGNEFAENGAKGAFEGGAINSEHAYGITVAGNRFRANSTGIAIWCNENAGLAKLPWAIANHKGCDENVFVSNTFKDDLIAWRLSDAGAVKVFGNTLGGSRVESKGHTTIAEVEKEPAIAAAPKIADAIGETRPVGARSALRGRENIIMGEWGPWDHESLLLRMGGRSDGGIEYQVFGAAKELKVEAVEAYAGQPTDQIRVEKVAGPIRGSQTVAIKAAKAGVVPYAVKISSGEFSQTVRGTIIQVDWRATFFSWGAGTDPRKDVDAWRALTTTDKAVSVDLKSLELPYGHSGPKDMPALKAYRDKLPGSDHFGMVARASFELPKGKWRFSTLSDDGVRVTLGGKAVIDNWTWHAPARDQGVFEQVAGSTVEITVEHFEIDGFATLSLSIEPVE